MLSIVITILVSTPELDIVEGIQGIQGKWALLSANGQYKTMKLINNYFLFINIFVIFLDAANIAIPLRV